MELSIFLVDDNSSDGTTEAVIFHYPHVNIIKGTGQLFWAGGMRAAWRSALTDKKKFNYYLLVNDDTFLYPNALKTYWLTKMLLVTIQLLSAQSNIRLRETFHTVEEF